mgnify:CR=1 FL=1|jgi:hypothetical protein|tara:strand:- start:2280 stop:2795 length:516 start_codon:yes stop_codon:yes gene_type:complete
MSEICNATSSMHPHPLSDSWTYWVHLPNDTNWSLSGYKEILTFNTAEEAILLNDCIGEELIKHCMIFLMKKNINPMWEAPKNRNGGSFSYKISNKNVYKIWKRIYFMLIGKTLVCETIYSKINGITLSPKKNFCILKIWLSDCNHKNPDIIKHIEGLNQNGCLFKKHNPEY